MTSLVKKHELLPVLINNAVSGFLLDPEHNLVVDRVLIKNCTFDAIKLVLHVRLTLMVPFRVDLEVLETLLALQG